MRIPDAPQRCIRLAVRELRGSLSPTKLPIRISYIFIYTFLKKNIFYYGKSDRQFLRLRVLFLIQALTAPVAKAFASCSGSLSIA